MHIITQNTDIDWHRQRLTGAVIISITAIVVLFVRLFYLQVMQGDEFRRLSKTNRIRLQNIEPSRGIIFDRKGVVLVDNRPSFNLYIILKDAEPVNQTLKKLSDYTGISITVLQAAIKKNKTAVPYKKVLLKKYIGRNLLAVIEAHRYDLPGIIIDVNTRRHYFDNQSAAHLIGYLGEINPNDLKREKYKNYKSGDQIGKFGIEKAADAYLRGNLGRERVEVDAIGHRIRVLNTQDATTGNNVYLTIDIDLQRKAESLLDNKAGSIVALEPDSGRVLVLVSTPTFDQNAFIGGVSHKYWRELLSNPNRPMQNKAIQGLYPPASTYKLVTAMAGLQEGVINRHSTYFCPGYLNYGGRPFRCWKKGGHGTLNVVQAIEQSCDVFFYHVGLRLGVDRIAKYAKAGGLGARTGIDLDHESSGLIPTAAWKKKKMGDKWRRGETLSIAIGQGYNQTTPLQMAVYMAAVANGGTYYKPAIIYEIKTTGGDMVKPFKKKVAGHLPVSAKNLAIVSQGLWDVVNGSRGTARAYKIEGIEMVGKTGTAQVFSRKKDSEYSDDLPDHLKAHAWFVAYAPAENPKIAMAVMVEHGEHGSSAAAPIASELIKTYLTERESMKF
ncbi:penicillin-binding protein 2 [Desulfococcaceae bacterium HSG9]|nr:penicillin-binding protein 2 [Desulfococcaceae bacterium HSG9]